MADDRPPRRTPRCLIWQVTVHLDYSNSHGSSSVNPFVKDVDARVSSHVEKGVWAGWGAITSYAEYQNGPTGGQSYHKLIRYRQGVTIEFLSRGRVYAFDYFQLLNLVIATVVLLQVCTVITDVATFYLLPNGLSALLQTRRSEKVNRKTAFAALGMRSAIAVQQFNAFDSDRDGRLTFVDLVKMFGAITDVDYNNAVAIAKTILAEGRLDRRGEWRARHDVRRLRHRPRGQERDLLRQVPAARGHDRQGAEGIDAQHALLGG
mmetsp:Transcript_20391/g.54819  ORF Transcript_20391/g.54819 Transcript_20391/m.54819 type:complete len:263 (-) Transcript_20391:677-1465(-)